MHGDLDHEREASADSQADGRGDVRGHGGEIIAGRALAVTRLDDDRFRVDLAGGNSVHARGLVLASTDHPSGLGDAISVDSAGATSVRGVWAVGDVTGPTQPGLDGAADGGRVGSVICADLDAADVESADAAGAAPVSARQSDWEARYDGEQVWSGNPNGTLVAEAAPMAPGRALDVGAGEGGDAVWLAEHGWTVTAAEISENALRRLDAVADQRALAITGLHTDANASAPFESDAFDLVTAHYASIHRTPDSVGIENILRAVAPGGTLLYVGHDPESMRTPIDVDQHSRAFDPDAYIGVDDVADRLASRSGWTIEEHGKRPRPGGAVSAHHVDDVVLRARRDETGAV